MQVIVLFQPFQSFEGVTYYHWRAIDVEEHFLIHNGQRYYRGLESMRRDIQSWAEDGGFEVLDTHPADNVQPMPARAKRRGIR